MTTPSQLTVAETGPTDAGTDAAAARPVLLLHGGGGTFTVAGLGAHLARTARVLTPTLPGWDGTPRPEAYDGVDDLAVAYLELLRERGLRDVLVVGSSLGGWIAAEMAVRDGAGLITGLVLIDAAGVLVEGEPMTDFFALDARGVAEHSFHDPDRFFVDPAALPAGQLAARQANMATMRIIAGDPYMHTPGLRERLADVRVPTLVLWGESDRVFTPGYGAAYAAAFADARFEVVPKAGHLPQIEQPEATFAAIDAYRAR
ncbi:alpha/beta fold hydrolase [Streptomyces sp. NPDC087422]|uniref:alpha/beta fold hydrolase n=1 Tax=Streptomyces sp. NPDC087422 TaxID=3365786 RepID=UPI00380712AA